ncbi:MAG: hypothetical protein ACOH1M_00575 [Rhodoglobus sp.]
MSGNRGPLDEDGITDTAAITDTRVADAEPVTKAARKSTPQKFTPHEASTRARSAAGTWLERIDPSMTAKAVEILGWENPKLSDYVRGYGYGAWTNSPSLIFVNFDAVSVWPDRLDAWLIATLKHESIHAAWFRDGPTATPPRARGHPTTFLIGLAHEKLTYRDCASWLKSGAATKLIESNVRKPAPAASLKEIKQHERSQFGYYKDLSRAHKRVLKLPEAKRENAAFFELKKFGLPSTLSDDPVEAMKQLYKAP